MASMRDARGQTPTQARIVHALSDGKWHPRRVLLEAIDEMADENLLKFHLYNLRKVLRNHSEYITFQNHPTLGPLYMLCRQTMSVSNG